MITHLQRIDSRRSRRGVLSERSITRWLAGNAQALGRLAGALLLVIAAFGIWVDILPNLRG